MTSFPFARPLIDNKSRRLLPMSSQLYTCTRVFGLACTHYLETAWSSDRLPIAEHAMTCMPQDHSRWRRWEKLVEIGRPAVLDKVTRS
jgi:hypothetical protein